jgi:hypothetical protein
MDVEAFSQGRRRPPKKKFENVLQQRTKQDSSAVGYDLPVIGRALICSMMW